MYSVAASADGKTIVAGGLDSVLRIWNDQGQEQAKFAAAAESPARSDGGEVMGSRARWTSSWRFSGSKFAPG